MRQGGGQQSSQRGMRRRGSFMPSLPSFAFGRENPFAMMRRFADEMDRFMGRVFEDFGFGRGLLGSQGEGGLEPGQRMWSPQIEVCEHDNQLIVCADLPGLKKEDLKVECTDNALIIQGERRHEHEDTQQGFHRSERSYGSFYRSIPLPEGVSPENAKATSRTGVLRITMPLPQQEQSRSRRIEIQGAEAQPPGGQRSPSGQSQKPADGQTQASGHSASS
ncbi:MAG TPA: Hsp20/alpha crystallin family protein [Methylomirabilota bacterium]|nr:Hsp20/alpha crystallin family protein [Methylomirabilota bacterium]